MADVNESTFPEMFSLKFNFRDCYLGSCNHQMAILSVFENEVTSVFFNQSSLISRIKTFEKTLHQNIEPPEKL